MTRTASYWTFACLLAAPVIGLAQDPASETAPPPPPHEQQNPAPQGGWRRVDNNSTPAPPNAPNGGYGDPGQSYGPPPPARESGPPQQLTVQPGAFLTVRIDQTLSTDWNEAGDAFSATLVQPLVVDGVVVAQRGQTVGGRVAEVEKGGRVRGVSKLGIQLTDLTLVDGQQVPLRAQLISRKAPTSVGRDAGAVATTTGLGAAVGAMAEGGVGAGIGAGAGAAAGLIGVLLTRGHPTVIYPESVLTFRIEAPIVVSTVRAPQAFRYVSASDYEQRPAMQSRVARTTLRGCSYYGCPPYYIYGSPYPYSYWGWDYPYVFGPSVFIGGSFHRGGFGRFHR